ncbi:hypothetical protein M2D07_030990 [Pseudomonas sp. BGr12]|uniref:hypothetical protein n=1 Tax=unclassified Pseudomonas TaxID=196821 RepID=UPI001CE1B788|nr:MULTISPECIES: hypothetical protein [unclassified Pseudomonas]MDL2431468.1 hypothetical protein [Pseudomonas sp. BJa5]
MDLNALMQQALARHGNAPGVILKANEPTGQQPWEMFVTEEHTEQYLALKAGGETYRGMPTGVLGGIAIVLNLVMIPWMLLAGKPEGLFYTLPLIPICLFPPFLWEISQPLPLAILFNRRTREIYYDHEGELYHMPWDEAQAVACQFMTVGPHSGGMNNATLETVVRRFGDAEQALFISLSPPMGKSLEMQCGFWAWLQAYMDNGPWFDENGQHSESDVYVKEMVRAGQLRPRDWHKNTLRNIAEKQKARRDHRYFEWMDIATLTGEIIFYPMHWLQDFTYDIAKRRSRGQWPQWVKERLHPDGPTTRLVDLERAQGLKV